MTPSLWFLVPAHGRLRLTEVCLRQLGRTCETLRENGIHASAVVVAEDENLDTARGLGFGTIERNNQQLGLRWNDAYELAYQEGVDYVMPLGSDDWIDQNWILAAELPAENEIRCMRRFAMVNENATRISHMRTENHGGLGIRIIPTTVLYPVYGRPCVEDKNRAIDATTLMRLKRHNPALQLSYLDLHPLQVVDWKSHGENLNTYESCAQMRENELRDPFSRLWRVYPWDSIGDMRGAYRRNRELVAA